MNYLLYNTHFKFSFIQLKILIENFKILVDSGKKEVNETEMAPGLMVLPVYLTLSERKLSLKLIIKPISLVVNGANAGGLLLINSVTLVKLVA